MRWPQVAECSHGLQLAILKGASLVVPGPLREDWSREWTAELWHVRKACISVRRVDWAAECETTAFCCGAFLDAACLRRERRTKAIPLATTLRSPMRCVVAMLVLITVSYGVGLMLPGVREDLRASPYRDTRHLMMIQTAESADDVVATIDLDQYRAWMKRRQELFDGFAFYRVERQAVAGTELAIAEGSPNLFALLGLPLRHAAAVEPSSGLPGVVLGDATWKRDFGGDSQIAGRVVRVGTQRARVIGVAPAESWKLPGNVDAWLLQPDGALAAGRPGFVVAHLKPSHESSRWDERWRMTAPAANGEEADFLCISLAERTRGPSGIFFFTVLLACLALPATTSLPLGEYRVSSSHLSWSTRWRRWSFLAIKLALLLPLVLFISLDLAHLRPGIDPEVADYIQIVTSFSVCLFGMRWMLRDQRQRCPVCLGKLTHPARVGEPSRNFLGWNGMELICIGGHGLLHVPEIPTSWFSTQRWLYLDPSWDVLFAEPASAPAA